MGIFNRIGKVSVDDLFLGSNKHYLVMPRSLLEDNEPLVKALAADRRRLFCLRNYQVRLRSAAGKYIVDPLFRYDSANAKDKRVNNGTKNSGTRTRPR